MRLDVKRPAKKSRFLIGAGVALLTGASIALASPALAADLNFIGANHPTVVTIPQGATATVNWTVQNTGAGVNSTEVGGGFTFNAPQGTTFPAQPTVASSYSTDGGATFGSNNFLLKNCTVGNSGSTLSCAYSTKDGTGISGWPAGNFFRFSPRLTANAAAATGTFSKAATMLFKENGLANNYTINYGTLDVNIVKAVATPMVDPVVGGGAALAGAAVAGGLFLNRRRKLASNSAV